MSSKKPLADRVRDGDRLPAPIALALSALTPVQRVGMAFRRMQKVHRVNACVISFGNITAGGTGKTPAVIERALREIATGRRVAVLTRGYAAPSGSQSADSTDLGGATPYHALGDEAALILQKVPGVIVIKNADRVAGAQRAIERHNCDTLILDDGFQQLRLAREEDIVLVDATKPFGNGHLLPRGILREPPSAIARATHLIITRADQCHDLPALQAKLRELAPNAPLRTTIHAPIALRNVASGKTLPLESLRDRETVVFCGIGNPQSFLATLTGLGAKPSKIIAEPDHAALNGTDLPVNDWIVTTGKDAARTFSPVPENLYALEVTLQDYRAPLSH